MKKLKYYNDPKMNEDSVPICEECGQPYHFLLRHVAHSHSITSSEYKAAYGLHPRKSIMSDEMRQKKSDAVHKNFDATLKQLKAAGKNTEFKKGNKAQDIRWNREPIKPSVTVKELIGKLAHSTEKKNDNILTGKLATKND